MVRVFSLHTDNKNRGAQLTAKRTIEEVTQQQAAQRNQKGSKTSFDYASAIQEKSSKTVGHCYNMEEGEEDLTQHVRSVQNLHLTKHVRSWSAQPS
eukprot:1159562-Pelagomonas_calceolata.AAC.5